MMRPWFIRVFSVLLFCLLSGQVLAGPQAADGDMVSLNFQDVTIRTVISTVSKLTGRNFVVDPAVRGKVTVIAAHPVRRDEVYSLFLSLLKVYRLAVVEGEHVSQIIPMDRARSSGQPLSDGGEAAGAFVTRLIRLKYIQAARLISVLRPLVPPKAYLAAVADSNMLIISDRAANCRRIAAIVAELDKARSGNFEIITLKYADAADLARVVQSLDDTARGKKGDIRVIADERTNSLIVAGPDFRLLQVKAVVKNLDTPVKEEGSTQVVYLRYARAKDLVKVLNDVPVADSAGGRKAASKAAARQKGRVSIVADENTNALVITAPPAVMRDLRRVIKRLDIRRPQVLIEAIIAEVSTGANLDLGVQWRATGLKSADESGVIGGTNFSSTTTPGINTLSSDAATAISGLGALSGLSLGYLEGSADILGTKVLNMAALLSAIASDADSNILSTPSLLTTDNQEAEIVVGNNLPFATGSYTSTGNNTPTNPFTTYERRDVGLKLKVRPQISEGDTIRLDIEQEVSNLSGSTGATTVGLDITTTRSIKTSVLVDDGKILVLGGLISDELKETEYRVPVLGSIPVLGWLFRYTSNTRSRKNLMVFLRPTIIRDNERSDVITFDKYDYLRRLQQDVNRQVRVSPGSERGDGPVLPERQEAAP